MAGSIQFRFSKGVSSTEGSSPLNGSYYVLGGTESDVDQILAIGTNTLISVSYGAAGSSSGDLQAIEIYSSQNCTLTTNGTGSADVQTVTITGTPTGGRSPSASRSDHGPDRLQRLGQHGPVRPSALSTIGPGT